MIDAVPRSRGTKVCLTPEFVDALLPPSRGEIWIGDNYLDHFGIRAWAGKSGGNKAFAIRLRARAGHLVRETFDVWRDHVEDLWWWDDDVDFWEKPLGYFLEPARQWADDRIAFHMGMPSRAEIEERLRDEHAQRVLGTKLGAALEERLGHLRRRSKRPAYVDGLEDLHNKYLRPKADLLDIALGDLREDELAVAITDPAMSYGNIRRLRAFVSGVLKEQAESYGPLGLKLDAFQQHCRERLDAQRDVPHPQILEITAENIKKFFSLLDNEPRWRQALAIRLYFVTGARLQQVLRARWSDIIGTEWYPFTPNERDCWFEARERLDEDALSVIDMIVQHHAREEIHSIYLFPSLERGPSEPIRTIQRMWTAICGKMKWVDLPLSHLVLRHKERTNPSSYLYFHASLFDPGGAKSVNMLCPKLENAARKITFLQIVIGRSLASVEINRLLGAQADYYHLCMPTVLRQGAYRLYFFSHEPNEPPHVHIDRGDATMKVWLADLAIAKSRGFRRHEFGATLAMVAEHRDALLEAWHEYFGTSDG